MVNGKQFQFTGTKNAPRRKLEGLFFSSSSCEERHHGDAVVLKNHTRDLRLNSSILKLFDVMRILISPVAGRFKEISPAGMPEK
jgi:hypothetical protein